MKQLTRREMIAAGAGVTGFTFLPARVLGRGAAPPSEKLNIGFVGIGERGSFNFRELDNLGQNIVAICDVDWRKKEIRRGLTASQMAEKYSRAKKYDDWRIMFQEQEKNLDAVVVATPDHDHAVVSLAAMKMGKHVYTEKPLTHTVDEARDMAASAKKYKVSTQTGCQGHSSEDCMSMVEAIKTGAIGDVRDVHIFANNSQGNPYAAQQAARGGRGGAGGRAGAGGGRGRIEYADLPKRMAEEEPVPEGLKWDLWLGPAPLRGYNPLLMGWRSFREYGDGSMGDWCCHYFDPVVWSLDLGYPEKIEARTDAGYDWATNKWTFPNSSEVRWDFPARGNKPPVAVTWHCGPEGGAIPLPAYWKDEYWPRFVENGELADNGGVLMIGSQGAYIFGAISVSQPATAATGEYKPVIWTPAETCRLIPDELDKSYKRPPKTIPRVFSHWADWVESAKARKPAGTHFGYSSLLTELGLLGNIATTQKGKTLYYDGKAGRFQNNDQANGLLRRAYREGFRLTT